jgi:hypothetical protein
MSCLLLYCAVAAVGGGLIAPGEPCLTARQYRVELKLVEVRADGGRNVVRAPRIATTSGAVVRATSAQTADNLWTTVWKLALDAAEESEQGAACLKDCERPYDCSWEVCVREQRCGQVNVTLSLKRHDLEKAVRKGVLTQTTCFNLRQQVKVGSVHRVALTHDSHGRATSWVEMLVEPTQAPASGCHPFEDGCRPCKPTGEMQLCPYWYEPF